MLYPEQIRAARGLLKMSALELSVTAGLALKTVQNIERSNKSLRKANFETICKIKAVLEQKGIKFIDPDQKDGIAGLGIKYYPVSIKDNQKD